jgi:hypothetical protein
MRVFTSLALGCLVAAGVACSSEDPVDVEPFPRPPPYSGGVAAPGGPSVSPPGTGAANNPAASGATNSPVGADTAPSATQVAPAQTTPSGGAGGSPAAPTSTSTQQPPPMDPPDDTDPPPTGPQTQVFLLFGQSNMWGVPNPQQQDLQVNPRVEVLTLGCNGQGANQWRPAQPPLHGCVGQIGTGTNGPGLGPGDYFGKALADAFPQDTILLVPAAVPGVSINTFQPGQQNYNALVTRARMAQQRGTIRGMIFHQGETDSGQGDWPTRVKTVVDRLRSDLGTGAVPFIAGELLIGGCCTSHNTLINMLPNMISNTFVARANGFTPLPNDGFGNLHFDLTSQREFGRRYGQLMIDALRP